MQSLWPEVSFSCSIQVSWILHELNGNILATWEEHFSCALNSLIYSAVHLSWNDQPWCQILFTEWSSWIIELSPTQWTGSATRTWCGRPSTGASGETQQATMTTRTTRMNEDLDCELTFCLIWGSNFELNSIFLSFLNESFWPVRLHHLFVPEVWLAA